MTDDVVFIRFGRLRARGNVFELRTLLTDRPYRLNINVDRARDFGQTLIQHNTFTQVTIIDSDHLEVLTTHLESAALALQQTASQLDTVIQELSSPDADLESVYRYLLEGVNW